MTQILEESKGTVLVLVPSITSVFGAGGVASRWNTYVQELSNNGWNVELWSVDSHDEYTRIPRFVLPFYKNTLTDRPTAFFVMKLYNRLINKNKPKIKAVISTDLFTNIVTGLCCNATNIPFIYSIHTDIVKLNNCPGFIVTLFQKIVTKLAIVSITTSPSFCKILYDRGLKDINSYYCPLSVDAIIETYEKLDVREIADARYEMSNGHITKYLLVYIGRWSIEKRLYLLKDTLLENCVLCFIGDGPIAPEVNSWHNGTNIIVLQGMKNRSDLAKYYAAADWTVSASEFETFGNVPYEAAHCGTPAILQNAQGFVDQIDSDENRGALIDFSANNAKTQLLNALIRTKHLLTNPNLVIHTVNTQAIDGTTISKTVENIVYNLPHKTGKYTLTMYLGPPYVSYYTKYVLLGTALFTGVVLNGFMSISAEILKLY